MTHQSCSYVHPRVVELMRERIGVDACEKMTDEDLVRSTEGTFFRLGCQSTFAGECIAEGFAALGRSLGSMSSGNRVRK